MIEVNTSYPQVYKTKYLSWNMVPLLHSMIFERECVVRICDRYNKRVTAAVYRVWLIEPMGGICLFQIFFFLGWLIDLICTHGIDNIHPSFKDTDPSISYHLFCSTHPSNPLLHYDPFFRWYITFSYNEKEGVLLITYLWTISVFLARAYFSGFE